MKLLKVGDIALDEKMPLENEYKSEANSAKSVFTIDGSEVVFVRKNKFKTLCFSSQANFGWQSKRVVYMLKALSDEGFKEPINLITDGGTIRAMFDYTLVPLEAEELFAGSDLMILKLRFKEVV